MICARLYRAPPGALSDRASTGRAASARALLVGVGLGASALATSGCALLAASITSLNPNIPLEEQRAACDPILSSPDAEMWASDPTVKRCLEVRDLRTAEIDKEAKDAADRAAKIAAAEAVTEPWLVALRETPMPEVAEIFARGPESAYAEGYSQRDVSIAFFRDELQPKAKAFFDETPTRKDWGVSLKAAKSLYAGLLDDEQHHWCDQMATTIEHQWADSRRADAIALGKAGDHARSSVEWTFIASKGNDAEAQKHAKSERQKFYAAHGVTVAVSSKSGMHKAVEARLRGQREVMVLAKGKPTASIVVEQGPASCRDSTSGGSESASVKRGTVAKPNPAVEAIQKEIRKMESDKAFEYRKLERNQSNHGTDAPRQNEGYRKKIQSYEKDINKLQQKLSRTPATIEDDNIVEISYPVTHHTRACRADVTVEVTVGGKTTKETFQAVAASKDTTTEGNAEAKVSPRRTPSLASNEEITAQLPAEASSKVLQLAAAAIDAWVDTTRAAHVGKRGEADLRVLLDAHLAWPSHPAKDDDAMLTEVFGVSHSALHLESIPR